MRSKSNKDIDWELLAKYLCGESSDEENALIHSWSEKDRQNLQLLSSLRDKWEKIPLMNIDESGTDIAWEKVRQKVGGSRIIIPSHTARRITLRPSPSLAYLARVAALVVLILGSSYLIISRFTAISSLLTGATIVASDPANGKSIQLSDGSTVYLNADSRIVYNENRKEHIRNVRLKGEAFFEVRHDMENPFIVTAKNAIIRVTGTSFNIRTEENTGIVSVFVESGSVEVSRKGSDLLPVIIEAGYSGLVTAAKIERVIPADPNLLSWKTKNLVFHETKMADVLEALNHTFHRNIVCKDERIMDFRFTGNFNNQPVDTILQVLSTAFHLKVDFGDEAIELQLEK